jgi:hypothetical protein
MKKHSGILVLVFLCMAILSFGQQKVDLLAALQDQKIDVVNRTLSQYDNSLDALEMNAAEGDGLGVFSELAFKTGTIELELLGENSPGRSFIGIAFNIEDGETFEAIYFRPFNFVAKEQIRKDHMVQYINHPDNTWHRLREERSGEFENEISAPPDPDGWFKAIIKVSEKSVEVYVDDKADAVLKVERLSSSQSDKIGLWVGNGSSGRFRNLVLL